MCNPLHIYPYMTACNLFLLLFEQNAARGKGRCRSMRDLISNIRRHLQQTMSSKRSVAMPRMIDRNAMDRINVAVTVCVLLSFCATLHMCILLFSFSLFLRNNTFVFIALSLSLSLSTQQCMCVLLSPLSLSAQQCMPLFPFAANSICCSLCFTM